MADKKIRCTLCQKEFSPEQITKSTNFWIEKYPYLCHDCHIVVWHLYLDENEETDEESEVFGYECLCCGESFDDEEIYGGICPTCGACSLDAMWF